MELLDSLISILISLKLMATYPFFFFLFFFVNFIGFRGIEPISVGRNVYLDMNKKIGPEKDRD